MYSHISELSIGIRVGALVVVSLPKCDPRPHLRWIDLNPSMHLPTLMGALTPFGKCACMHFYVLLTIVFGMLSR